MFNYCIIGILAYLLQKRKVTARELAEKFEISTKTVYRYLLVLECGGIPLNTTKGRNGGISIDDNYSICANLLTEDEKDYIFNAISGKNNIKTEKICGKLNIHKEKNKRL